MWDLLEQSKAHRDALYYILKIIDFSNEDPNAFVDFCVIIQDYMRPSITFYMNEVYHIPGASNNHIAIYIIAYIDGKGVKRVMIDEGLAINVVSIVELHNLNILISYLSDPTFSIRAFNNNLYTIVGVVVIPIKVGVRLVSTTCHVVEGEMQYNILLV